MFDIIVACVWPRKYFVNNYSRVATVIKIIGPDGDNGQSMFLIVFFTMNTYFMSQTTKTGTYIQFVFFNFKDFVRKYKFLKIEQESAVL